MKRNEVLIMKQNEHKNKREGEICRAEICGQAWLSDVSFSGKIAKEKL